MRHHKKRYVLLPAVESFMVPCALYRHRGDVTLGIEPEICITIPVVRARAGSDAMAGSRKLCWHDVWLSQSGAGNQKIRRVKGPGSGTVQRVRGDMHYRYCKEFMKWWTNPLTKKVTVSTVNRKLKELRQLQGIYTYVYHLDLPIHDLQRMSCTLCGQSVVLYDGFTADSGTPVLLTTSINTVGNSSPNGKAMDSLR